MNIAITIPKAVDFDTWLKECEDVRKKDMKLNYYLGSRGLPKKAKPGDKCYVIHDSFIRGYHIIEALLENKKNFVCETTEQYWPKGNYIVRKGKFYKIEPIKMKGFQGFRYLEEDKIEKMS